MYFIDQTFEPQAVVGFCGVSATLQRMMSNSIDAAGDLIDWRMPWKASAPTQVASGTMVCRYLADGREAERIKPHTHGVRLLEPFESMRVIGWDDSFWDEGCDYTNADLDSLLLLCNMACNAHCRFHYLPWTCAVIGTHGR